MATVKQLVAKRGAPVLVIMLAIIISLHTMKLIVPTKFTKNIIDIVPLRIPEVSINLKGPSL